MKKILYFAAVLSAFMTSCTSENEIIDNTPTKGASTITASFDQPASRAQMGTSDGTHTPLRWNAGDQLVVYNATSHTYGLYQTASSVSDGDAEAVFDFVAVTGSNEIVPTQPHLAVYPYARISPTNFAFVYSSSQTYTENSFDRLAMPMVASNSSGTAFNNFTAQAAVLRLKVSTTASDVTVSSIDIESASMALTGEATPNMTLGKYGVPTTGKKVTLNCETPVAINSTAKDFNIVVPSQTYPSGDLTITVKTNKGDIAKTSKAAATFEAGKVYNLTISGTPAPAHEYVEISADYDNDPSTPNTSLKWAKMNVGATAENNWGDYFAWGETEPRYTSYTRDGDNITNFEWKTSYGSGYASPYATYSGTTLDAEHDAATANWGGTWRTPTQAEFQAMYNATKWTWDSTDKGYYVTAKDVTLADDKSNALLFFPAAGVGYGTSLLNGGTDGYYWSSSLFTESDGAYTLTFNSFVFPSDYNYRYYGFTVRPVSE